MWHIPRSHLWNPFFTWLPGNHNHTIFFLPFYKFNSNSLAAFSWTSPNFSMLGCPRAQFWDLFSFLINTHSTSLLGLNMLMTLKFIPSLYTYLSPHVLLEVWWVSVEQVQKWAPGGAVSPSLPHLSQWQFILPVTQITSFKSSLALLLLLHPTANPLTNPVRSIFKKIQSICTSYHSTAPTMVQVTSAAAWILAIAPCLASASNLIPFLPQVQSDLTETQARYHASAPNPQMTSQRKCHKS